jgi:FKBP-type peptidyl-prolyl cis-trans isomerase FkpA
VSTKQIAALFLALAASACATAEDAKPAADAKAACAPAPKDLVAKDLKVGDGKTAGFRNGVMTWYTGWLYDACAKDHKGKQFDSNVGSGVPFGFMVGAGKVIKGWDEGVLGMREGGKRLLVIPADKAYGDRGAGGVIPPGAPLVFEVELVQIGYQPLPADAEPAKK